MSIAGHVSRAMLSRYSHVRMEAKRRALDEIAARQRARASQTTNAADLAAGGVLLARSISLSRTPSFHPRVGCSRPSAHSCYPGC
jgi:hypothetical protein